MYLAFVKQSDAIIGHPEEEDEGERDLNKQREEYELYWHAILRLAPTAYTRLG
jgi:hypothetical protein